MDKYVVEITDGAILTLEIFPERYPIFDIEPEHSWKMRRMAVDDYLVCYMFDPEKVTVTDILFGASNLNREEILKQFIC